MSRLSKRKQQRNADAGTPASSRGAAPIKPAGAATGAETIVHLLLIAAAVLIGYSNVFHAPFVFDDFAGIVDNAVIKDLDNFISSGRGYDVSPRRFIGYLTFALNYRFGGLEVVGYHIVNLVVHMGSSFLVYFLVALTFRTPYFGLSRPEEDGRKMIALVTALFFASHPVQTQAVTYIYQRFTSLATCFYLLSVVMYVKGRLAMQRPEDTGQRAEGGGRDISPVIRSMPFYLCSLISAILAMRTKETAFTLPFAIILHEFIFFKSTRRQKLLFLLPVLFALAIVPLALMTTGKPLGEVLTVLDAQTRVQSELPRWDYLMTQLRVITTYIRLIFLPVNQNLDYDYPIYDSLFTAPVFFSFLFLSTLLGCAAYLVYRTRNSASVLRVTAFGIFWFFITLSVESSVMPIVDVIFEHRVYLPSAGAFLAITTAAWAGVKRMEAQWPLARRAAASAAFLAVIAFLGATYARNGVWTDKAALWEDVASKSAKASTYVSLGIAYAESGELNKAIEAYLKALALDPKDASAYLNLGTAYTRGGFFDEAIKATRMAVSLAPSAEAHNNLGHLYYRAGRLDEALQECETAVKLNPDFALAHNNLGAVFWSKGRFDKAVEHYRIAVKLDPDNQQALHNLELADKLKNQGLPGGARSGSKKPVETRRW
jgi:tetratricopeptide (TPR) repeat protein